MKVIRGKLRVMAKRYIEASEEGKLETDAEATRFIHRNHKSEAERLLYKKRYEEYKEKILCPSVYYDHH